MVLATEESRLNATADLLNSKTATAASNAGFTFVNPTSRFVGHAVCDDVDWLNGLSNPVTESYHPDVAGHRDGYAVVTKPAFGLAVKLAAAPAEAKAVTSADSLARDARRYAAVDRTIRPERFVAPDLTTPAARAAAARAGVDLAAGRASTRPTGSTPRARTPPTAERRDVGTRHSSAHVRTVT